MVAGATNAVGTAGPRSPDSNRLSSCNRAGGDRGEGGAGPRSNRPTRGLCLRSARDTRLACPCPCTPIATEDEFESEDREEFNPDPPRWRVSSIALINSDRSSSFSVGSRRVLYRPTNQRMWGKSKTCMRHNVSRIYEVNSPNAVTVPPVDQRVLPKVTRPSPHHHLSSSRRSVSRFRIDLY